MELKEFCLKIHFILRILLVISIVILSTVIIMELTSEPSILRILVNTVKGTDEEKNLVKFENSNGTARNGKFTRNIHENNTSKTKNYYEEQMPVVVYSRTDVDLPDNQNILANQNTQENDNNYYESHYYDDNDADAYDDDDDGFSENEGRGRSSHYNDYDMYYSQWLHTTSSPHITKPKQGLKNSEVNKHKLMRYNGITRNRNPPSPLSYEDYYDYYSRQPDAKANSYPVANVTPKQPAESTWVSVLKTLKTLLDLYKSFITVWNSMAEQQYKQQEFKKEQQTQQKTRINSKKPANFGINKNNKQQQNKLNNKTAIKTDAVDTALQVKEPLAKVEPRKEKGMKGDKMLRGDVENLSKRSYGTKGKENEAQARYIKGDPLKGYYDFVITEGSYKFWAAFQVGTALLIIYSTFAAIYYSKVNPLVSDYDYVDYLGGGRSLSAVSNLDFVDNKDDNDDDDDDGDDQRRASSTTTAWYNGLITQSARTVKFILQTIDKLPANEQVELKGKEEIISTSTLPYHRYTPDHF
ncbi:uncharacterized protein ACN2A1_010490 [Glossina fuscipes fuscipes]